MTHNLCERALFLFFQTTNALSLTSSTSHQSLKCILYTSTLPFVFYAAQTVAASGSGNVTADADGFAPPWVGNPQRRGTLTIVIKCVMALLLAAWVPLHLNIPSVEQSIGARLRGFGFWATFTFLIPKWVVYVAFEQWRQMRKFLGEKKRAKKELHEKQNSGISRVLWLPLQEVSLELLNTILLHWCHA